MRKTVINGDIKADQWSYSIENPTVCKKRTKVLTKIYKTQSLEQLKETAECSLAVRGCRHLTFRLAYRAYGILLEIMTWKFFIIISATHDFLVMSRQKFLPVIQRNNSWVNCKILNGNCAPDGVWWSAGFNYVGSLTNLVYSSCFWRCSGDCFFIHTWHSLVCG